MKSDVVASVYVEKTNIYFDKSFSYSIPKEWLEKVFVGQRVLVPFGRGNRKRQGIIKGFISKSQVDVNKIKPIFELVDEAGYDFSEFFNLMAVSVKAVSTSSPDQKIHINPDDNPMKKADSNLKVPDLDDWLNS